jgi:hypothetical protein
MGNRMPCHRAATAAKPAMPKTVYGIDSPWCSPLLERRRIKILHYQVQVTQHRFPKTLAFSARRNQRSQCVPTAVQVRFHGDPFTGMREIRVNEAISPALSNTCWRPRRSFPERDLAAQVLPGEFAVATKTSRVGSAYHDPSRSNRHPSLLLRANRFLRPSEHACNYRYEHDGEIYNEDVEPDRCAYCFLPNE